MKKIEVAFDQAQLTLDKGEQAVKDAVTAIRNALRAGTASTKSKGEVAGSNKKPWKQKGTGNARAGFRQSPVWRGGGVAHGPHPRSYEQKINKKVMKLAFARAFSDKLVAGDVIVLDEFKFEAPKTKLMVKLLKELGVDRTACIVQKDVDDTVVLAASNIPTVDYSTAQALDVYTVLANRKLVCDKDRFSRTASSSATRTVSTRSWRASPSKEDVMTIKELKEKTEGVILNVLITEKGSRLSAENRYLLEVAPDARKPVIAAMAEKAFGVHVLAVKTANMKGGLRYIRGTRRAVTEPTWKKAIVTVKQGERIELA